jgi:hypothetical protein
VSAGTDADFIVKLIDVYPDDYSPSIPNREADAGKKTRLSAPLYTKKEHFTKTGSGQT